MELEGSVYRAGAQEEPLGDLGVGQALGHQPKNLQLARAQTAQSTGGARIRLGMSGPPAGIYRDGVRLGDGPLQGKVLSRGPGGGERFPPELPYSPNSVYTTQC